VGTRAKKVLDGVNVGTAKGAGSVRRDMRRHESHTPRGRESVVNETEENEAYEVRCFVMNDVVVVNHVVRVVI
jgi:hypothetical protein